MVVRWKNKDSTGGVLTRPYTPEERAWLRDFSTWDHGGPYLRVAREACACSVFHQSSKSGDEPIGEAAADQAQPNLPPEKVRPVMALTHQDGATFVTQRLKLRGWRSKSPTCLSWARLRPTRISTGMGCAR